jgi:hypothetical protein
VRSNEMTGGQDAAVCGASYACLTVAVHRRGSRLVIVPCERALRFDVGSDNTSEMGFGAGLGVTIRRLSLKARSGSITCQ